MSFRIEEYKKTRHFCRKKANYLKDPLTVGSAYRDTIITTVCTSCMYGMIEKDVELRKTVLPKICRMVT
jgi:hypothetical protein